MKKLVISTLLLITLPSGAVAQLPNEAFFLFENKNFETYESSRGVTFDFQSTFFVRNNEYFTKLDPGATLFGYQLYPSVIVKPFSNHNLTFTAGAFLQKDFGEKKLTHLNGNLTLDYKFKNTKVIFGAIHGGLEHQLIEPLYQFERTLYDRLENGFQIIHNDGRLWADAWIDWRQTVKAEIDQQEILESGLSLSYLFSKKENERFKSKIIAQLTNQHQGGTNVALRLTNRTNSALGLDLRYKTIKNLTWIVQPYFVHALDHSIKLTQPYKDGYGIYLNGGLSYKGFTFLSSYWHGVEYFSPLGMPMFNSFAYDNYHALERNRELLFARFIYTAKLIDDNFIMDLRFEPIYDMINKEIQHSMGIYFIFRIQE